MKRCAKHGWRPEANALPFSGEAVHAASPSMILRCLGGGIVRCNGMLDSVHVVIAPALQGCAGPSSVQTEQLGRFFFARFASSARSCGTAERALTSSMTANASNRFRSSIANTHSPRTSSAKVRSSGVKSRTSRPARESLAANPSPQWPGNPSWTTNRPLVDEDHRASQDVLHGHRRSPFKLCLLVWRFREPPRQPLEQRSRQRGLEELEEVDALLHGYVHLLEGQDFRPPLGLFKSRANILDGSV